MPLKSRLKKLLRHDRSSSSATPAPETAPEQGSFAVSSALLEPNHDPNPSPSPINDPQLTIPEGLWGEAYENLRTENAELLKAYENILLLNWHSENNDAEGKESINSRLRALIDNRLEDLQKSRLKFNVAGKEVVVKDEVHRALKSILSVNNFITTAVSSDPHASLAWAGVLVLLNPIAQSATQDEDAMQGFERIASLLARYRVMEHSWIKVYSLKTASDREGSIEKLNSSIRSQTVRLYTAVLKFQMRLAKHYLKSGVYRFLEDVIAVNDWNGMMQTITDLDKYITDDLRALSDQALQDIQNKMNDLQNDLGGLLDLTIEARDEAKVNILLYVPSWRIRLED
ncbi:hypothetical protein N7528_009167 [Penicillium herquei]|nr:hypothetical protein N7528_009167 [Penicillium herquei]